MAYRLKRSQSVAENVKRILREESGSALESLRVAGDGRFDDGVHEVRKSLKKMRALLRLLRPELGKKFERENARLRDAGQRLSDLRDAGALIGAFDQLSAERKLAARVTAPIRRRLVTQKRQLEEEAGQQKVIEGLGKVLREFRASVGKWPADFKGFAAIEPGFEEAFRQGKKALAAARKSGGREDYHEWRKRVKDHWYHVRLLEKLWTDVLEGYEHSLKNLEDALGEDLNLAILRERVAGVAGDGVVKAIDGKREELRKSALEIGERVYAEKPKDLARRMERLWKAWR